VRGGEEASENLREIWQEIDAQEKVKKAGR